MAMWGDDDDDGVGVPQERRVANGDLSPPARPAPMQAQRLQVVENSSATPPATESPTEEWRGSSTKATVADEPAEEPVVAPRAQASPHYDDEEPPLVARRRPGMSGSTKTVAGIAILALAGIGGWVIYSSLQTRASVEDIVVVAAPTAPLVAPPQNTVVSAPIMASAARENAPTNQITTAPTGAIPERMPGQAVATQDPVGGVLVPTPGRSDPRLAGALPGDSAIAAAVRENLELNQRILQTLQGVVTELSAIRVELDRVQRRVAVAEAAIPAPRRPAPAPAAQTIASARPVQIAPGATQARPPIAVAKLAAVARPVVGNTKGLSVPAPTGAIPSQVGVGAPPPQPQPPGMFAMTTPAPAAVEPVAEPARVQTAVAGLAAVGVGNRTVYVRPGDTVPGYGRVKSIDPTRGQLLFENGSSISQ